MMQIGDLAGRAGVSTRTIRYYEELGIIEPETRSNGGFRRYSDDQLRRLEIIQGLKALGFELEHIHQLFSLRSSAGTGGNLAQAIIDILGAHQEEIDRKINHYLKMKEHNTRSVEILKGCLGCATEVLECNCHGCDVYRGHAEVPDLVESAIFEG